MAKFSLEDKIKAVKDVLELGMPASSVAKLLNTPNVNVRRWVARYEAFGFDGLSMKAGTYSGDFKVRVIEYIQANSISLFDAAVHFGIPNDSTVGKWERIYWEKGPEALYKDDRGRKSKVSKDRTKKPKIDQHVEEDLISEVQRLRMENEYLKKLNALVRAREKLEKKTK